MLSLLWTIPALPLAGFTLLALLGARLPRKQSTMIGTGSVGLSALVALGIALRFFSAPPENHVFRQHLWTWLDVAGLRADVGFTLDSLSLVMVLVVTLVGYLIHVYSTEYMAEDKAYARFFAYMNLFVAAMLVLVLADNLLLLFLGWEGVGLCSYLLIGFWFQEKENCIAATKAFLVTKVGDVAMLLGILVLFTTVGSLDIATISARAPEILTIGCFTATLAAALLLGGALGKSGQLPLQVWLPDAMAGPTPVSALIHAATMVTAGVYLIARMSAVFELAPAVQHAIAVIGALTLLLAGIAALAQRDIKRVLAYSTISQIGYMFLALGVGAYSAAMFHFMTHAIFKALLFMSAGAVIVALHHEQDIFKMGGLRKTLPGVFIVFLIGAMSLTALPLVTSGFYSKDLILWHVWNSDPQSHTLWAAGLLGAFFTALYTFRMLFIAFFGTVHTHVHVYPGRAMMLPLATLAVGATVAGFLELPSTMGHLTVFSDFIQHTVPAFEAPHDAGMELKLQIVSTLAVGAGIVLAFFLFAPRSNMIQSTAESAVGQSLAAFMRGGLGFDWVYDKLLVRPYVASSIANQGDIVDLPFRGVTAAVLVSAYVTRLTQTGRLRWYATCLGIGTLIAIYLVIYT